LNALFRFCFESPKLFGIKFATAELDIRKRLYAGLEAAIANYLEQRSGTERALPLIRARLNLQPAPGGALAADMGCKLFFAMQFC
jgi:hypothetical protein